MTVLLLDGNTRQALAATRALGRQGVRVDVGADCRHSLASASRYCSRSHVYPSPTFRPAEFRRATDKKELVELAAATG